MSDGPHRTLSMRKGWKHLLKHAYRDASSDDDVLEALSQALLDDCREEIPHELRSALENAIGQQKQAHLFEDDLATSLDDLRGLASGYPLAQSFLDCAIDAANQSPRADLKLVDVLARALAERAVRGARQAEEHCKKKANATRAAGMRSRLDQAISQTSFSGIAAGVLGNEAAHALKRHDGLDDGVPLP